MRKFTRVAALVLTASFAISAGSIAAKPKPKAKTPPRVVQGTTQLKGDQAQFGLTYTLGKDDPMNVTLNSAEYTVDHVKIGEETYIPTADEKLLVLHFTYHNPQKNEKFVRWDTHSFTIVDPQDQNHDGLQDMGMEKDRSSAAMSMKPAQKCDFYGIIKVPAAKEMPKLIIKNQENLVLRYDLKGKVKGLPAPYADPADSTGATALAKINAVPETEYPIGMFEFKFVKAEYNASDKIADYELSDGEKFFFVKFVLKNVSTKEQYFRWDAFPDKLIDADGVELCSCADLFQASKDKSFSAMIQPGQEMTFRYLYKIAEDAGAKTFSISQPNGGRTFLFDISNVK